MIGGPFAFKRKLSIVGGGIVGAMKAYFAFFDEGLADLRVTLYEKNGPGETTAGSIAPSLTPDEALSVLPPPDELLAAMGIIFYEPGGIRVDDVPEVHTSKAAKPFLDSVAIAGLDKETNQRRTQRMLEMGKISMQVWQQMYEKGDDELKLILEESNFNPCREPKNTQHRILHDGYRIDLIYDIPNAHHKAEAMKNAYETIGYHHCDILSPAKVCLLDPYLADFCAKHAKEDAHKVMQWDNDTVALLRPGGCLNAAIFLEKFYPYLQKLYGKYNTYKGEKNKFHIKYHHQVIDTEVERNSLNALVIKGLKFLDGKIKRNKRPYKESDYFFAPGEAVGTLAKVGLDEPPAVRFAGASLKLRIPLDSKNADEFKNLNHCMEVHNQGVVLAWQVKVTGKVAYIAVAGTKAFHADVEPKKEEAFCMIQTVRQFNMINNVLPKLISIVLGRDTSNELLTEADLKILELSKNAVRWVGSRAVSYDGGFTIGKNYINGEPVTNSSCATHLGSGGVSCAPAAVIFSGHQSLIGASQEFKGLEADARELFGAKRKVLP